MSQSEKTTETTLQAANFLGADGQCERPDETWLTAHIPYDSVELPGFATVRADRDTGACGKSRGGGFILYVNSRWCNPGHLNVKAVKCGRDCELLAVSLRPYYLPREFTRVIAVCVYIPPRANAEAAAEAVHTTVAGLQTQHPEALIIISGDFNHNSASVCGLSHPQEQNN